MLYKYYKLIPHDLRSRIHFIIDLIDKNPAAIIIVKEYKKRKFSRAVKSGKCKKLRVGESRQFTGWISTNNRLFSKYYLDLTDTLSHADFADFVYSDNVLEHLSLENGIKSLELCYKILKPGGVMRIATPDCRNLAKAYLARDVQKLNEFGFTMQQHGYRDLVFLDLLRLTFTEFGHESGFIYDYEQLEKILIATGFRSVTRHKTGLSNIDSLRNLESRNGNAERWGQLCVQAVK